MQFFKFGPEFCINPNPVKCLNCDFHACLYFTWLAIISSNGYLNYYYISKCTYCRTVLDTELAIRIERI